MRRLYHARYGLLVCALILGAFTVWGCGDDGEYDALLSDAGSDARDARIGDIVIDRGNAMDASEDDTDDGGVSLDGGEDDGSAEGGKPLCGSDCEPFSLILLPDTQYYTNKSLAIKAGTYKKQTQWIVDNAATYNIKYVIHLGDITNNNTVSEWKIAKAAHKLLDKKNIAYSVVTGNHDYAYKSGNKWKWSRSKSLFNKYFGYSVFKNKSWYKGRYGSKEENINNYGVFTVGGLKFMVLSLEFAPRSKVITWADNLIAEYKDHYVIIATHCYLNKFGHRTSGCGSGFSGFTNGTGGKVLWEKLASKHRNVLLVASGHIGGASYRVDKGEHGNMVYQMLVDYQFEGKCTSENQSSCNNNCRNRSNTYTGNGWMRRIQIDPITGKMTNYTFSVEQSNKKFFGPSASALENKFFCSELNKNKTENYYASSPSNKKHHTPVFDKFSFAVPLSFQPTDNLTGPFDELFQSASAETLPIDPAAVADSDGTFDIVWQDYVGIDDKLPVMSDEKEESESLEVSNIDEEDDDKQDDDDDNYINEDYDEKGNGTDNDQ